MVLGAIEAVPALGLQDQISPIGLDALLEAMASPDKRFVLLSGGSQQNLVLTRWRALRPKILIIDDPARGICVAAKAKMHQPRYELARSSFSVVTISSKLHEILTTAMRS